MSAWKVNCWSSHPTSPSQLPGSLSSAWVWLGDFCWTPKISGTPKKGTIQNIGIGVPWWLSRLRIWHCHCCGSGCCCGVGLIPDLGTFSCHRCSWNQKQNVSIDVSSEGWVTDPLIRQVALLSRKLKICYLRAIWFGGGIYLGEIQRCVRHWYLKQGNIGKKNFFHSCQLMNLNKISQCFIYKITKIGIELMPNPVSH